MRNILLRFLGHRATHHALSGHSGTGRALDVRFGLALLKDRRVPVLAKVLALGLGAVGMALLIALELPAETMFALFMPVLGLIADVALDGLEGIVGPFLLAALLLPYLAPKPLVETVRRERALTV